MQYQFSVGTITVGGNDLGIATDITVSYDGDPQSFYGGDYRLPLAVELGNRTGQITCSTVRFDTSDDILDNKYVTVVLATGSNSGGLVGSLTNCKVTNYEVVSTQNGFAISNMTMLITSQDAADASKGGTWPAWA